MPRYPKIELEKKLEWMRERQRQRQAAEAAQAPRRLPSPETQARREQVRAMPKYLRVDEVAAILGVSHKSVQRWLGDRAHRVGGRGDRQIMLISRSALEEWLAEHGPTASRPA